ncbi:MAG: cytochrome c-type biogenesis protein CcmH [Proteobacteria bacterium]|nr:cytochrome c-type biogenesis protein CcmH [Pseudomonadota bacterium]MCH8117669.1 cytochrome c-type biogenesis protein CcmH [Pseudomonadota bacterium]
MKIAITFLAILLSTSAVLAIDTERAFDDPELQARYETIISEIRCVQCQNQSIKDSNVFLAADLRREIRRMLGEGKTDAQVYDFLVARYGEFALYRPRVGGKTLVLWLAPLLLLAGGAVIMLRVVRRRMTLPIDDEPAADE